MPLVQRAIVILSVALLACESAANLDVVYSAGTASDAGTDAGIAEASVEEVEGCPCDERQGLGCCVAKSGVPYCTGNQEQCALEKGLLLKCFRGDWTSESECCWYQGGTRLTVACDGGPPACLTKADCKNGAECATIDCNGIVVGACGATKPTCPL
jgi:hypothetical protein